MSFTDDPAKKLNGDSEDEIEIEIVEGDEDADDDEQDQADENDQQESDQENQENQEEGEDDPRQKLGKRAEKRIKQLVAARKLAEEELRKREARIAELEAQQLEAQSRVHQSDVRSVEEHSQRLDSSFEAAKSAIKTAREAGDFDAELKAQEILSKVTVERQLLDTYKKRLEATKQPPKKDEAPPRQARQPQPTKRDLEWISRNSWFGAATGQERVMTMAASTIDQEVRDDGVLPEVDIEEYYREIDTRMRKMFPDYFKSKMRKDSKQKVIRPTTGVNKTGKKIVRLTQSQLDIARRLGVPPEEYARQLAKMEQQ